MRRLVASLLSAVALFAAPLGGLAVAHASTPVVSNVSITVPAGDAVYPTSGGFGPLPAGYTFIDCTWDTKDAPSGDTFDFEITFSQDGVTWYGGGGSLVRDGSYPNKQGVFSTLRLTETSIPGGSLYPVYVRAETTQSRGSQAELLSVSLR